MSIWGVSETVPGRASCCCARVILGQSRMMMQLIIHRVHAGKGCLSEAGKEAGKGLSPAALYVLCRLLVSAAWAVWADTRLTQQCVPFVKRQHQGDKILILLLIYAQPI